MKCLRALAFLEAVLLVCLTGPVLGPDDNLKPSNVPYSGRVRAADQFVPGATVTATQENSKVVGYTDEEGRYRLDLGRGVWTIRVEMFGFTPVAEQVKIGDAPLSKHWILEMSRTGAPAEEN